MVHPHTVTLRAAVAVTCAVVELPAIWIGTDLGPLRDCDGTYCDYPVDSLPPLPDDRFDGTFGWLAGAGGGEDAMEPGFIPSTMDAPLPEVFERFMARPDLLGAVRTCTSCYWDVSERSLPGPDGDGDRLVRFLADQQDCVLWYLHLRPDGSHRVVAGGVRYDEDDPPAPDRLRADLIVVAPDFERFVYRFWVENLAWFEVVDDELPPDEWSAPVREYLAHYVG